MWIFWVLLIALAIALVYFAVLAVLYTLAYLGLTIIIPLDFFGSAFTWLGVKSPAVGWLLYGCVIGAIVGLVMGLRKVGRTSDLWKVYVGAAGLLSLLFFGSYMAYSAEGGLETRRVRPVVQATPQPVTPPVLQGTWAGTFSGKPASLVITNVRGSAFSGTLTVGGTRIAVSGATTTGSQQVAISEKRVLSRAGDWALGEDTGSFSNDGRSMSGTGRDARGSSYSWSFEKR